MTNDAKDNELTVWDADTGERIEMDEDTYFTILYEALARPYRPAKGSGILDNSTANVGIRNSP